MSNLQLNNLKDKVNQIQNEINSTYYYMIASPGFFIISYIW